MSKLNGSFLRSSEQRYQGKLSFAYFIKNPISFAKPNEKMTMTAVKIHFSPYSSTAPFNVFYIDKRILFFALELYALVS